jgi:hypothetical protein
VTVEELRKLAEGCLKDYKPRLKVLGLEKYDKNRFPVPVVKSFDRNLESFDEAEMKHEISQVLNQLAELKDGFIICGPEFDGTDEGAQIVNVSFDDLSLTFAYRFNQTQYTPVFHIGCAYYPRLR